jgi:hypothetical protein
MYTTNKASLLFVRLNIKLRAGLHISMYWEDQTAVHIFYSRSMRVPQKLKNILTSIVTTSLSN